MSLRCETPASDVRLQPQCETPASDKRFFNYLIPASDVRLQPQVWDSSLRCETPVSDVRFQPHLWDSSLRCETPASDVRPQPQMWDSSLMFSWLSMTYNILFFLTHDVFRLNCLLFFYKARSKEMQRNTKERAKAKICFHAQGFPHWKFKGSGATGLHSFVLVQSKKQRNAKKCKETRKG